MKLMERKNTTAKGLEELQKLVDSFDFCDDINNIDSRTFYARYEDDNGYMQGDFNYTSWTNLDAKWQIKEGELLFLSIDYDGGGNYSEKSVRIGNIDQLNFQTCLKALEDVIKLYNIEIAKKDSQIEAFLIFCENYKTKG